MMKCPCRHRLGDNARGLSLIELMITTMLMTTLSAIAVPAGLSALDAMELGNAAQEVSIALQTARLRAVSANRPMRLRLNCPRDLQYRVVEVTGVAATDSDPNRCDDSVFWYPGPRDSDPATPANDGPLRYLSTQLDSVTGPELEFSPDGTTRVIVGGVAQTMTTEAVVQVTRKGVTREIEINALGRIRQLD